MRTKRPPKVRFHHTPLYRRREPHAIVFLAQRSSFWIATLSIVAFLVGNMVGQHGWYVFWASVWGEGSDAYIAYTGVVSPIEKVPNYREWALKYGGDPHVHTFKQVPEDLLVPLPPYNPSSQSEHLEESSIGQVYSVGYDGAYATGGDGDGSHPAVDIRVPVGTPVRAIANGIVSEVREDSGFGKVVVLRHPNVPDPAKPRRSVTLYSAYAHLSAVLVEEGMVVQKGERIALSGQTGNASGPHLHFQIDREDAPWHPYWPFTTAELRAAGFSSTNAAVNGGLGKDRVLLFTVSPMLYVQANYAAPTLVATSDGTTGYQQGGSSSSAGKVPDKTTVQSEAGLSLSTRIARLRTRTAERARTRLSRMRYATPAVQQEQESRTVVQQNATDAVITNRETVVTADAEGVATAQASSAAGTVASVAVTHDGSFAGRGWETVTVTLLGEDGRPLTQVSAWMQDLYLRAAFGAAEFRPVVLKERDFTRGKATVQVLPRGQRTLVIQVQPFNVLASPMPYKP